LTIAWLTVCGGRSNRQAASCRAIAVMPGPSPIRPIALTLPTWVLLASLYRGERR
jgi:hypothetical protein